MAEYGGMHSESPGDVYTEIGSWSSGGQIVVFARDTYTDVTVKEVVDPNDEDYDAAYWRAVKSCITLLAAISGPGAPSIIVTTPTTSKEN